MLRRLYNTNRERLAEVLLDKALPDRNEVPLNDCVTFFKGIFESASPPDDMPMNEKSSMELTSNSHDITHYIDRGKIEKAMSTLPKNTSPGADSVAVALLRQIPVPALLNLFNLWLHYQNVPTKFKECRTILLPKCSPVAGPDDYRPITISSLIYRLFAKILNQRLSLITELNKRQKAFIRGTDGCGENAYLLKTVLAIARREHRELCIASLDIAKAFDSVSHHSVLRALARQNADPRTVTLVKNLLADSSTRIEHSDGISDLIMMMRGVKQGDPLSPLLFSLVVDELADELDCSNVGFTVAPNTSLCSLVFSDDILVLSDCKAGLQSQLLQVFQGSEPQCQCWQMFHVETLSGAEEAIC
uniref:Reverse transcriptase domain-containing protein n=1 Tax=Trichuris muris TaxID=70415 RepID=A0A5S6QFU9_TRIMR